MARFVQEIIDGKLVVSKKKKVVLIQELRDKKYRPFPKGETNKKVKNTDEDMDQEDEADPEDEDIDAGVPGANDYDYLLSVSSRAASPADNCTNYLSRCKSTP